MTKRRLGCVIVAAVVAVLAIALIFLTFNSKSSGRLSPGPVAAVDPYEGVFAEIDDVLKKLVPGNIAFNVPGAMDLGEVEIIELLVSPTLPHQTLQRMIDEKGMTEGYGEIRLSERMQARLVGHGVMAITPEEQLISWEEPTRWEWQVQAVDPGVQVLHLSMNAIVRFNGESVPRSVRTFKKEIRVRVTPGQRVLAFVQGNWQWLWATIVVPAGAWLWRRRQKVEKAQLQAKSQSVKPQTGPPTAK
jgi:hypothetical protein